MNKVNTITFCLRDYESIEAGMNDVYTALRVLLDAGYIVNVRYDEPGLKILCVEFESANKSLGGIYPYWLTPEQAELVYYSDEEPYEEPSEIIKDQYSVYDIREKLKSISEQNNQHSETATTEQETDTVPAVQKYATKLSKKDLDEFNSSWQDILYDKNGVLDVNQMMRELLDYAYILKQIPKVYSNVTGGLLSKPYYDAATVIEAFERCSGNIASQARLIADDWDIVTEECKTNAEYKQAVLDYLNIEED